MPHLTTGRALETADRTATVTDPHSDKPVLVIGNSYRAFEVIPGHLDDAARQAFTHGQCHAFARALSAATGWPAVALLTEDCHGNDSMCLGGRGAHCPCRIGHLVCLRPDGAHVDINGAHQPLQVPSCANALSLPMTAELWSAIDTSPAWREPNMPVAVSMVAPLLTSLIGDVPHRCEVRA
ncbi:hypothetical protein ABT160_45505 [Streptomyces sp. NPDC001941]|uniref:hypothetical protein n=1 Tax=Streptomyces sp. NPDC001941 TaxID=3154659 RepID=UPI00332498E2